MVGAAESVADAGADAEVADGSGLTEAVGLPDGVAEAERYEVVGTGAAATAGGPAAGATGAATGRLHSSSLSGSIFPETFTMSLAVHMLLGIQDPIQIELVVSG